MEASATAFNFTDDDRMFPVYCTQCRVHIPLAVSNQGGGLCPQCIHKNAAVQAQLAAASNTPPAPVNTFMGACPQCSATHIVQFDDKAPVNTWGHTIVACFLIVAGFIALPMGGVCLLVVGVLILLVAMAQSPRKIGTSRECKVCGCRWKV